jgi:hypothetical protein
MVAGVPTVVSGPTRAPMTAPLLATSGTTTTAVWAVGSLQRRHAAWARLDDGVVVASGDILDLDPGNGARLLTRDGTFVLYGGGVYSTALYQFAGGAWTRVSPAFPPNVAVSGSLVLGLADAQFAMSGRLFDGVTLGSSMSLSPNRFAAVAADGSGGFGVITVDTQVTPTLRLMTYDGTWSSEAAVATVSAAPTEVSLVRSGARWAVEYTIADVPTVAILDGGVWTSQSFPGSSSRSFALAATPTAIALAGDAGFTAVHAGGAWTQRQLNTNPVGSARLQPTLVSFAAGFALVYGGDRYATNIPLQAAVHDGNAWPATPTALAVTPGPGKPVIAVGPSSLVVGFSLDATIDVPHVATFGAGAWSTPVALTAAPSRFVPVPAIAIEPAGARALFAEPGTMRTRSESTGSWSAPATLPATPTAGSVGQHALARAGNGHLLSVWIQDDADGQGLHAAEHDGLGWGPPVALGVTAERLLVAPSVAGNATGFVIAWNDNSARRVAAWTGNGISTPTDLGSFSTWFRSDPVYAASDGTSFVVAWADAANPNNAIASHVTSTDGITWTAPQPHGDQGYELFRLVGGPAGVVALSDQSSTVHARVWHAGAWSSAAVLYTSQRRCAASVATTTALALCLGASIQGQLWAGDTWSSAPVTPANNTNPEALSLANDGSAYRVDYHRSSGGDTVYSSVLQAGTWSPLATSTGVLFTRFVASLCGGWVAIHGDDPTAITGTTGDGPYPAGRATVVPMYATPILVRGPAEIDGAWLATTPDSLGVPQLHVSLGL